MYYLDTGTAKHTRFRNAVIAALLAHTVAIAGVSFTADFSTDVASQIEVTLAMQPSADAPDKASKVAQANQEGSGDNSLLDQVTSANQAPPSAAASQARRASEADDLREGQQKVASARDAERKVARETEEQLQQGRIEERNPEVARLNRELETLQAELDEQTRAASNNPRVRRLTSASARRSVDAAYLLDWRQRLEAVGNKYYPEASVRYGIFGNVKLMVVIRYDGTLEDVRVLSSSGYAVLDEAAIKVVRMAAPFAPFPKELRETTDKLEIVRTWQYLENQLSSN